MAIKFTALVFSLFLVRSFHIVFGDSEDIYSYDSFLDFVVLMPRSIGGKFTHIVLRRPAFVQQFVLS